MLLEVSLKSVYKVASEVFYLWSSGNSIISKSGFMSVFKDYWVTLVVPGISTVWIANIGILLYPVHHLLKVNQN